MYKKRQQSIFMLKVVVYVLADTKWLKKRAF